MEAAIMGSIRRILMEGMKGEGGMSAVNLSAEVIANAASWAIYGAVKEWFETPEHPPAEQVAPAIAELILPMIMTHDASVGSL